jgi:hypothetical protein
MVIGDTFAYGHIPKTGGDAVHAWLSQLEGLQVDPIVKALKHDFFWQRAIRRNLYVLSIRRLPFWALSYLQELANHPAAAREYGIPPGDTVRPEYAFLLRPDEYLHQHQAGGRPIGVWLRMEHLFDDVIQFIDTHIRPVTLELRQRLSSVPTKGRRNYDHNIHAFFSTDQIADLYATFPVWSAIERNVYGSLYDQNASSGGQSEQRRMAA